MGYKKIVISGDLVETYEYEKDINRDRRKPDTSRQTARDAKGPYHADLSVQTRSEQNIRKSKQAFARVVRANLARSENPAFLTLTTLETYSLVEAWRYIKPFWLRIRKLYGERITYIVVPEFQKKGGVHFHALVWGIPEEVVRNERSTRLLQRAWGRGFLDIRCAYDRSPKIASYLSKYMYKAMSDKRLCRARAYSVSRNALRPMHLPYASAFPFLEDIIGDLPSSCIDRQYVYDTLYLGSAVYTRYIKRI